MLIFKFCLTLFGLGSLALALTAQPDFAADVIRANLLQSSENAMLEKRNPVPAGYDAPPYYPAPKGGWVADWSAAYSKAQKVVANMTLAEKVNLTTGTGFLMGPCVGNTGSALRFGIPNLCLQDSALGIAATDNVTAFPAGITVGATFSKALMHARGFALGEEARGKGVNIQLGPTIGPLGRKPRGGRNWEGFGADPVLQGWGGAETIKGMQANGVIATVKHFVGNEQEMYRMDIIPHGLMRALSSNIDDRTLHELYAWPFMDAIKAGAGAIMTSYNEVNGSAASQNSKLINGILKDEFGFQGLVMSDWLAQIGGVSSALAGLDMAMPGDGNTPFLGLAYWAYDLSTSVLNGTVPLERLNDMVTRIVATWYQFGQDQDYPLPNFSANTDQPTGPCYPAALISPTCATNQYVNVQADHAIVARNVSREGITLLKNFNNTLPLSTAATLKVFGSDAQNNPDGINSCNQRACNKGVLGMGWGSGTANYPYLDAPIDAIKRKASQVTYYSGDSFPSGATVAAGDIAIVFISSDAGENQETVEGNNGDRSASGLEAWHNGDALVNAAAAKYSTVIVVVHTVGPILVEKWIDLPSVKGVLFAHLPGQEAGNSLTDILFGDYSPSGHLPYSIPKAESDYPSSVSLVGFELFQVQDTFSEGLYIDYRYLNKQKITPRYAFGHGLSYTTFSHTELSLTAVTPLSAIPPPRQPKGSTPIYSSVIPPPSEVTWPQGFNKIWRYLYPYLDNPSSISASKKYSYPAGYQTTPQPDPPAGGDQGGNPALWDIVYTVKLTITNTGFRPGKDVAMLFLQYPSDSPYETPIIQLRAFDKTDTLAPGQSQAVTLEVTRRDLSVWDVGMQNWVIPASQSKPFVFWVGSGSANLSVACESLSGACSGGRTPPVV
ncbi:Beta-glucosidase [Venustampulla echinocandica]|uniref:beta-glucosidase n=1 Tax=Venustampulla echinocandica TaxID=2656787 RepID=A0A370TYU6_9HELO|nr:Beta-glucosidase [Venustampulla echinocandica]RDL40699.1 Beta-glucosidase [Venustampulla echinocandica]